jgi:hypothetical protein
MLQVAIFLPKFLIRPFKALACRLCFENTLLGSLKPGLKGSPFSIELICMLGFKLLDGFLEMSLCSTEGESVQVDGNETITQTCNRATTIGNTQEAEYLCRSLGQGYFFFVFLSQAFELLL